MDEADVIPNAEHMKHEWTPTCMNAYRFKLLLSEFCTRHAIPLPVYRLTNDGTPEAPSFTGHVLIKNVEYTGEAGKENVRDAEQAAAKEALMQLKRVDFRHAKIAYLVHNGGLTINLLNDYAHRMGYLMPLYTTRKVTILGALAYFVTTAKCGQDSYEGPAMKTNRDAEVNVATFVCSKIMAGVGTVVEAPTVMPNET